MEKRGDGCGAQEGTRSPSNGAASAVLRGNDAGRGKPRLYKLTTGPYAGTWMCKDGISGVVAYGKPGGGVTDVQARDYAYLSWDWRSSLLRRPEGWCQ